jgi:hypothetical protein
MSGNAIRELACAGRVDCPVGQLCSDLAGAGAGGKLVVSRACQAYDAKSEILVKKYPNPPAANVTKF